MESIKYYQPALEFHRVFFIMESIKCYQLALELHDRKDGPQEILEEHEKDRKTWKFQLIGSEIRYQATNHTEELIKSTKNSVNNNGAQSDYDEPIDIDKHKIEYEPRPRPEFNPRPDPNGSEEGIGSDEPNESCLRSESNPNPKGSERGSGSDEPNTTSSTWSRRRLFITAASAVVGCGLAVKSVPLILTGIGFTAAGVAGKSIAAAWMSAIGPIGAGTIYAILQSIGAAGIGVISKVLLGVTGGALGGSLARYCTTSNIPSEESPESGDEHN